MAEVVAHETDAYAIEREGTELTIRERIWRIANDHGYGYHNEHHTRTRSRALEHARANGYTNAVLTTAHTTYIGNSEWRVYYID